MRITLVSFASLTLAFALLVACGSTSTPAGPGGTDAGTGDDGSTGGDGDISDSSTGDGGFAAAHAAFPPLAPHHGKVFAAPHVVTLTYAGYNYQQSVEDFGNYIVTSNWMTTVGKDYGVGAGTHTAGRIATAAPPTIDDTGIQVAIDTAITAGTIPAPPATGGQMIYLIYFPKSTQIDDGTGSILCSATGAVGYHYYSTHGSTPFAYAVIADCSGQLADVTSTSSHEIIETATDPYDKPNDGYYMDPALPSLWHAASPNENADLCQYEDNTMDGPWAVQRIWSMTAAAAGGSPCLPAVSGEIYFNTSAAPDMVQKVAAGESATFTMTGWSTAEKAAWKLAIDPADTTDFDPAATLSAATIQNGTTVTVTLTAPAGTPKGKIGAAYVASGQFGEHYWPVAIQVK